MGTRHEDALWTDVREALRDLGYEFCRTGKVIMPRKPDLPIPPGKNPNQAFQMRMTMGQDVGIVVPAMPTEECDSESKRSTWKTSERGLRK